MKNLQLKSVTAGFVVFLAGLFILSGCVSSGRAPQASLDTPEHHVFNGVKLFDANDLAGAAREFALALELDPGFSRAYYGAGLVKGHQGAFSEAFENLNLALEHAGSKEDRAFAHIGMMRVLPLEKGNNWLSKVEKQFQKANFSKGNIPDSYFYMGMAFKQAGQLEKAAGQFDKVLKMDKGLVAQADKEYAHVQQMIRALPGNETGRHLALDKAVTRADTAAILVHELEVDRLFKKEGILGGELNALPRDVENHPLKTDIAAVMAIGLKGMMPFSDGYYYPGRPMTRARYAMAMGDIIATLTRDKGLRARFVGTVSPFPDVDAGAPYFNDIMVCSTRGIMEPVDFMSGRFDPEGGITGAQALLMIRKLKEKLKE